MANGPPYETNKAVHRDLLNKALSQSATHNTQRDEKQKKRTYCFFKACCNLLPSLVVSSSGTSSGRSSSVINCLAPFLISDEIQPNVHTLKMFAVRSGLSGFKRGLSSGSARN